MCGSDVAVFASSPSLLLFLSILFSSFFFPSFFSPHFVFGIIICSNLCPWQCTAITAQSSCSLGDVTSMWVGTVDIDFCVYACSDVWQTCVLMDDTKKKVSHNIACVYHSCPNCMWNFALHYAYLPALLVLVTCIDAFSYREENQRSLKCRYGSTCGFLTFWLVFFFYLCIY